MYQSSSLWGRRAKAECHLSDSLGWDVNARVERPYHDITLIVLVVGIAVALLWWIIW